MPVYIDVLECAEKISEKFNIPISDSYNVIAEIPAADVVPRSALTKEIFEKIGTAMCDTYNEVQFDAYTWHMYGDTEKYPLEGLEKLSYLQGIKRMIDVLRDVEKKCTKGGK